MNILCGEKIAQFLGDFDVELFGILSVIKNLALNTSQKAEVSADTIDR
jgi:hypothetical protein